MVFIPHSRSYFASLLFLGLRFSLAGGDLGMTSVPPSVGILCRYYSTTQGHIPDGVRALRNDMLQATVWNGRIGMAARKAHHVDSAPWGEYILGLGPVTASLFAQLPVAEGWTLELLQGRIIRMPGPGYDHAAIQANCIEMMNPFLRAHKLGLVVGTGCYIFPTGNVLCPDLSYVQPQRLAGATYQNSYPIIVPDFVAEIVSPTDTRPKMVAKVRRYIAEGVRLVWLIWPTSHTVDVWRTTMPHTPVAVLTDADQLDGLDVFPGFTALVAALFA
jgi:Uma2 family endonuclease